MAVSKKTLLPLYSGPRKKLKKPSQPWCSSCTCQSMFKYLIIFSLVWVVCTGIFAYVQMYDFGWYLWSDDGTTSCWLTPVQKQDLLQTTLKSVEALDELKVPNYALYGTLLGALRHPEPIAWDQDYDIGVNRTDIEKVSFKTLKAAFNKRGLSIYWNSWGGFYRVGYTNPETGDKVRGDIMVYHDFRDQGWMQRIGWESWAFFINYHKYHRFPAEYVRTPLQSTKYGEGKIWLPSQPKKLVNFFYPNSLEVVKKPPCAVFGERLAQQACAPKS